MELNELESLVSQLKSVLSQAESVLGKTSNQPISKPSDNEKRNYTIVTGLWNLKREEGLNDGRNFDEHYLKMFDEFLQMPMNLFIYVPQELEQYVWDRRDKKNTYVKIENSIQIENLIS